MSNGRLAGISEREREQRRRALLYAIGLVFVILVAIVTVVFATITVAQLVRR